MKQVNHLASKPRQIQYRANLTMKLVASSRLYRLKAVFYIKKLCKVYVLH